MNEHEHALQDRLSEIKKRLLTLEWDKAHNQLNAGMAVRMDELRTECAELEKQLAKTDV